MKILKFSGIVVGIHLFALILIFANPGCSSSTKQPPAPAETAAATEPGTISMPGLSSAAGSTDHSAAATTSSSDMPVITGINAAPRYSPTRPGSSVASTVQTEPAPQFTPATTYSVVSGDNLTVIAKRHHLTIAELAAANNLKPSAKLQLGQKLVIPSKAAAPAPVGKAGTTSASPATNGVSSAAAKPLDAPAGKVPAAESVKHVVKSGETLGGIARKYGVKQGDIAVQNNISDPKTIRPGQELVIPGWQAPTGKSAKPSTDTASKPVAEPKPYTPPAMTTENYSSPTPPPPSEVPVIKIEDSPPAK